MPEFKETIISKLWERLSTVSGIKSIERNAKAEPAVSDMPAIRFFELLDVVEETKTQGATKYPAYKRKLTIAIESFVKASEEGAATKDLLLFVREIKKKLYEGGNTFGLQCYFIEVEASRVFRPPVGEPVAGIAIVIEIFYTEDIKNIF